MPKITKIVEQQGNRDRISVYIDNVFCTGIRKRTFQDMGLKQGDEISCDRLKEMESHFWKEKYGSASWEKEKVRLEKVKQLVHRINPLIDVQVVGFGADSNEIIREHPEEKGKPDLRLAHKNDISKAIIRAEVTGTEYLRGSGYWVRPDKLEYAENHPDEDIWIILHYSQPSEKFIFIKPIPGKIYQRHNIDIRGAGEIMCIFEDQDIEVKTIEYFAAYLNERFV